MSPHPEADGPNITASELRSFAFCKRSWFLEREGNSSALAAERERGVEDHLVHAEATTRLANEVQGAAADAAARLATTNQMASVLLLLGAAGILATVAIWWLSR